MNNVVKLSPRISQRNAARVRSLDASATLATLASRLEMVSRMQLTNKRDLQKLMLIVARCNAIVGAFAEILDDDATREQFLAGTQRIDELSNTVQKKIEAL